MCDEMQAGNDDAARVTAECISALHCEIRQAEPTVERLRAQSLKQSSSGDEALLRVLRERVPLVEEEAQVVDETAWTAWIPLADDPEKDRYDPLSSSGL